ncbi:hypothetical protein [Sphingobium chungbukense]|uniref:hypothetical protein n=1 Tax=Sphingobium chungbukense TaxID=56193 RepID=UPI0006997154|nr:hypothetical protein [Sphingobium chungbukense]
MEILAPQDDLALAAITEAVGAEALITDAAERAYHSQDVFSTGPTVLAVFRPTDKDMLARGIAAATQAGWPSSRGVAA